MKSKYKNLNTTLSLPFKFLSLVLLFSIVVSPPSGVATLSTGTNPQKLDFQVKYRNNLWDYRVAGVFVLPNEKLDLGIHKPNLGQTYTIEAVDGEICEKNETNWFWKAPAKTGLYTVKITESPNGETLQLNIFVMVPYNKATKGMLNGYKIGSYPSPKGNKTPSYEPPTGFIEVTEANKNTYISPNFRLQQFLCKQQAGYPKYIALREGLITKLEKVLERVNEVGYPCSTLYVMSGYRTPYYNRAINNVKYSRHQYGDAADIFIDENHNNRMDDLNGDGVEDFRDIQLLSRIIDREVDQALRKELIGGMGTYKPTKSHGPFVHLDARGTRARWGN
jgi:Peptidase M15